MTTASNAPMPARFDQPAIPEMRKVRA